MRRGDGLTEEDVEAAFRMACPGWILENLDTGLGTAGAVTWIKGHGQCWGAAAGCEDGPFSDGENPEWWARCVERIPAGVSVRVVHEYRDGRPTEVIREGRVVWNQLANMATIAALELRRRAGAAPAEGEQTALPI